MENACDFYVCKPVCIDVSNFNKSKNVINRYLSDDLANELRKMPCRYFVPREKQAI